MWNFPYNPNIDENIQDAWVNGYVHINENFAHTILEEVKKQKAKAKDKNCLLNFYPKNKIPRNTRCESTGLKYKNCCGKIS